jgi:D-hexose-6-phosphate mutarotase
MVYQTLRLTSSNKAQQEELQHLVHRLTARGYPQTMLVKIINTTYQQISNEQTTNAITPTQQLHTYFHPNDPKSYEIQKLFEEES